MEKLLIFLLTVCSCAVAETDNVGSPSQPHEPATPLHLLRVGDPQLCLEMRMSDSRFPPLHRFEVLPGIGWDNLQNTAKGQVVQFNYSRCLTTDDGRYLIPDNVFTVPLKESFVETFAEMIDTWHNTSSTTSNSINVNAGLSLFGQDISGSFSYEHTEIKKKQVEDKSTTVRVQLRYHRYKSYLQPDASLHPAFRDRLLDVAASLALGQKEMAQYQAELIVRDFGTHVQTSVIAGAGLSKTDFLKRDLVASQFDDKTKVLASANVGFKSFCHMSGSHGTEDEDYKKYLKAMTHSYVVSHGGPLIQAFNVSLSHWTRQANLELAAMDRSGDPLSYLVTRRTLPELPNYLVDEVEEVLRQAIVQYYEMNTISGCTKMDSPNFSVSANFDDGSCEAQATNMTFGGVYQTCEVSGKFLSWNPCNGLSQVNPKTRGHSCPEGYTAVKLTTGRKAGRPESQSQCHSCGFLGLFECCSDHHYSSTAVYTTYWCAALGPVAKDSGYLFGGIFSSVQENRLTGSKGCPPSFYARQFLDHHLCISDDFELGTPHCAPFGGFISCSVGNPLSMPGVHPVGSKLEAKEPRSNSLYTFMAENNQQQVAWPKTCPKGYSQHLASVDNGCEIRYCLQSGALGGPTMPRIKSPPFRVKPNSLVEDVSFLMFDADTHRWAKDEHSFSKLQRNLKPSEVSWTNMFKTKEVKLMSLHDNEESSGIGPGVIAAFAVVGAVSLILIAVVVYKRRKPQPLRKQNGALTTSRAHLVGDEVTVEPNSTYGAVRGEMGDDILATVEVPSLSSV